MEVLLTFSFSFGKILSSVIDLYNISGGKHFIYIPTFPIQAINHAK